MTPLFTTDRLSARRLFAADAAAMAAIYGDREAMRYVGDGEPLDEAACLHWIEITDRNFERRGYGMVAFVEHASGEIVGCGGIVHPGQQEQAEVKYALRPDRWGMGYATEAVSALVAHARSAWSVASIIATVDPANLPSQKVLAKAGFSHASDRVNEDGTTTQVWESYFPSPTQSVE